MKGSLHDLLKVLSRAKTVAHVIETTRSLYLDIDANSELEGRIIARRLLKKPSKIQR